MQKVTVNNFSISSDGFGAGLNQDMENPLGKGGMALHQWFFPTETFKRLHIQGHAPGEGEKGIDNDIAAKAFKNTGACIMGRNMFGPIRGGWADDSWKGWWGINPPFHCPVYVLTNHSRESIVMEGGTTFHFITDGIEAALELAKKSAGNKDVQICGGVSTIQQYLNAKLIDEMHIAISPIFLGSGERLFDKLDLVRLGYAIAEHKNSDRVMHIILRKT